MAIFVFTNNAQTSLAANIGTGDTVLAVAPGTGAEFPNPGAGEQFTLTLIDAATGLINEIMYCTARAADALTVVRAREGTTAKTWAAGSTAAHFLTAGTMQAMLQAGQTGGRSAFWSAGGSANALTITPVPAYSAYATGMVLFVRPSANNTGAATINVNGLGAKSIRDQAGDAITADMLVSGRIMEMGYDGTNFILGTSPPVSSFIQTLEPAAAVTGDTVFPVDDGTGDPQTVTSGQVAAYVGASNFATMFFLGGF